MSESDRLTIEQYISETEKDPTFAATLAVARLEMQVAELRAALRELVEFEDSKTALDAEWHSGCPGADCISRIRSNERLKPLVWAAARALIKKGGSE